VSIAAANELYATRDEDDDTQSSHTPSATPRGATIPTPPAVQSSTSSDVAPMLKITQHLSSRAASQPRPILQQSLSNTVNDLLECHLLPPFTPPSSATDILQYMRSIPLCKRCCPYLHDAHTLPSTTSLVDVLALLLDWTCKFIPRYASLVNNIEQSLVTSLCRLPVAELDHLSLMDNDARQIVQQWKQQQDEISKARSSRRDGTGAGDSTQSEMTSAPDPHVASLRPIPLAHPIRGHPIWQEHQPPVREESWVELDRFMFRLWEESRNQLQQLKWVRQELMTRLEREESARKERAAARKRGEMPFNQLSPSAAVPISDTRLRDAFDSNDFVLPSSNVPSPSLPSPLSTMIALESFTPGFVNLPSKVQLKSSGERSRPNDGKTGLKERGKWKGTQNAHKQEVVLNSSDQMDEDGQSQKFNESDTIVLPPSIQRQIKLAKRTLSYATQPLDDEDEHKEVSNATSGRHPIDVKSSHPSFSQIDTSQRSLAHPRDVRRGLSVEFSDPLITLLNPLPDASTQGMGSRSSRKDGLMNVVWNGRRGWGDSNAEAAHSNQPTFSSAEYLVMQQDRQVFGHMDGPLLIHMRPAQPSASRRRKDGLTSSSSSNHTHQHSTRPSSSLSATQRFLRQQRSQRVRERESWEATYRMAQPQGKDAEAAALADAPMSLQALEEETRGSSHRRIQQIQEGVMERTFTSTRGMGRTTLNPALFSLRSSRLRNVADLDCTTIDRPFKYITIDDLLEPREDGRGY